MKKKTNISHRFLLGTLLFSTLFLLSVSFFTPKTQAGVCDGEEFSDMDAKEKAFAMLLASVKFDTEMYCKIKEWNPLVSIQRTVTDAVMGMLTSVPMALLLNVNPDDFGTCGLYLTVKFLTLGDADNAADLNMCKTNNIFSFGDDVDQKEAIKIIYEEGEKLGCNFNSTPLGALESTEDEEKEGSVTQGSLMGMTSSMYQAVTSEPPPVDLGYYAQRNIQKIPILNQTAYAQQQVSYNAWGLELVLVIWNTMKNIAFAMMSVIMLIIGVMIITRKKINPQAIVTVQQALPRVFISLFLITFSYTIGALFASAILPLTFLVLKVVFGSILEQMSNNIFFTDGSENGLPSLLDMNVLVVIYTLVTRTFGAAAFTVFALTIGVAMTIIALLVAVVKILILNVKILLNIIFAPIQFALAAIPGQEGLITDWFKNMTAKVLGIPAIVFFISLAWYLLVAPFVSGDMFSSLFCDDNRVGLMSNLFVFLRGAASITMTLITLPLMTILVMFFSVKADKKIEDFIMGPKKGGKK